MSDITIETCELGHRFAKLDSHPTRDGLARCPHCLVAGLNSARADLAAAHEIVEAAKGWLVAYEEEVRDPTETAPCWRLVDAVDAFNALDKAKEAKTGMTKPISTDLSQDLAVALNRFNAEGASNTPDFILAQFLVSALAAWNTAVQQRETWYGRDARPSSSEPVRPPKS
ncbi:MAG: hypothetical protein DDT20_00936 [Firmicutes bacterium]|nr:hypothetical protein [Bacillota bacterium]